MELKACIDAHQITIVTGQPFCGKTSSIDMLVQATNSTISPARTAKFDPKSRGVIDVLRAMSNERRLQNQLGNLSSNDGDKRIFQYRISLSNFTSEELACPRFVNGSWTVDLDCIDVSTLSLAGHGQPAVLSSILDPMLNSVASDKFQIWLCVDTSVENLEYHLSILRSSVGMDHNICGQLYW